MNSESKFYHDFKKLAKDVRIFAKACSYAIHR